jgi:hypothetical protein
VASHQITIKTPTTKTVTSASKNGRSRQNEPLSSGPAICSLSFSTSALYGPNIQLIDLLISLRVCSIVPSITVRCKRPNPPATIAVNTERWERGFAALRNFRAREGHCCPSRRHVEGGYELGQWVSVQRYRKGLLPVARKRRLDRIEFVWDWRDYLWEQNFAALLKFKRREGHCCVPILHTEDDLKLGWWVATQRRNRKELSTERSRRLNKIGFVWKAAKGPASWNLGIISHRATTSRQSRH